MAKRRHQFQRLRTNWWFVLTFAATAIVTVAALAVAVSDVGLSLSWTNTALLWGLGINLLLILGLASVLAVALWRLWQKKQAGDAAARLHLRYVAMFSLAAATPAVVVAVIFGIAMTQGLDDWFSTRIKSLVEQSVNVARSYVREETDTLKAEVLALATDLNRVSETLSKDPGAYQEYLEAQATYRNLPAVYVMQSDGTVLAQAESPQAPPLSRPRSRTFFSAGQGDLILSTDDNNDLMRALYRLENYNQAYLYVVRYVDAGILSRLRAAEASVVSYRNAEAERQKLQMIFALAYIEAALLILVGAAWLGRLSATRITAPVRRLVVAAGRVARGDLSTRINPKRDPAELRTLSVTFNHMTAELSAQRSELVRATEDAEDRRAYIEAVLSGVSAGVISLDEMGRVSAMNSSAVRLLDLSQGEALGRHLSDVVPSFMGLDLGETPVEVALSIKDEERHLMVRKASVNDGAVLTFDDVTQLMVAQRHAAWRDVARRIAHEIKNPLTPIQLSVERLQRKFRPDPLNEADAFDRCTHIILRQVNDIGRMVDEFSTFARMPAPVKSPTDVIELCREAMDGQQVAFPKIAYRLHVPNNPVVIDADERLLTQALTNILKNAAEAVEQKRATGGTIDIAITPRGTEAVITVADNGVGLPHKDRHRLTEPYFTKRDKGTGLGLAIVRRTVEDHGGTLTLDDNPDGDGALVRLVLPQLADLPTEHDRSPLSADDHDDNPEKDLSHAS